MNWRRIGERSTHQVTCTLCGATFGNAGGHDCKYSGRGLKMYLDRLEQRILELEEVVQHKRSAHGGKEGA